jgi:hypothetical protein
MFVLLVFLAFSVPLNTRRCMKPGDGQSLLFLSELQEGKVKVPTKSVGVSPEYIHFEA